MQKKSLVFGVVLAVVLMAGAAMAGKSSMEYGKQLFNDPTLSGSTNEQSCTSCHAQGQDLEQAEKKTLSKNINHCLTSVMQGERIDGRSAEMRSLKMYVMTMQQQ